MMKKVKLQVNRLRKMKSESKNLQIEKHEKVKVKIDRLRNMKK